MLGSLLQAAGTMRASSYVGTKAGQLDGVDEYLTGGTIVLPGGAFSVTGWVWVDSGTGCIVSVHQGAAQSLYILATAGGVLDGYWESGNDIAQGVGGTLTAGAWRHFGFTCANAGAGSLAVEAYISGASVDTGGVASAGVATTTATLYVGRRHSGANYLAGKLADLAIWPTTLSDADVTALYNGGVRKDPRTCGVGAPSRLYAWTADDDMTGTTGSIEELMGGTALTPFNTESGDLVAGPP